MYPASQFERNSFTGTAAGMACGDSGFPEMLRHIQEGLTQDALKY